MVLVCSVFHKKGVLAVDVMWIILNSLRLEYSFYCLHNKYCLHK